MRNMFRFSKCCTVSSIHCEMFCYKCETLMLMEKCCLFVFSHLGFEHVVDLCCSLRSLEYSVGIVCRVFSVFNVGSVPGLTVIWCVV